MAISYHAREAQPFLGLLAASTSVIGAHVGIVTDNVEY